MPLSDVFIDEHFGEEINAIRMERGGSTEEHVAYFRGGARLWLTRAEVISRMMRGRKFYARVGDWRGEIEVVEGESAKVAYLHVAPDAKGNGLLSLPRA